MATIVDHTRTMSKRAVALAVTFAFALGMLAWATTAHADDETGVIAGHVSPPAGFADPHWWRAVSVSAYGDAGSGYQRLDAAGNYAITGLAPGEYVVEFTVYPEFDEEIEEDVNPNLLSQFYSNQYDLESADPVVVTAGATTVANAQLEAAGIITGRVSVPEDFPDLTWWKGVTVVVSGPTGILYRDLDEQGNYSVSGLVPGDHFLEFAVSPYYDAGLGTTVPVNLLSEYFNNTRDPMDADPVDVTPGSTFVANAFLAAGGILTGRVTAPVGADPRWREAVRVIAHGGTGATFRPLDANGDYEIVGLPQGHYKVEFNVSDYYNEDTGEYVEVDLPSEFYEDQDNLEDADAVQVSAGATTTINAHLGDEDDLPPIDDPEYNSISGVVTLNGVPAADVDVTLYAWTGDDWEEETSDSSAGNGAYSFGGLLDGTYAVVTPSGPSSELPEDDIAPAAIALTGGQHVTRNLAIAPPSGERETISGTVVDQWGFPVEGATVTLLRADDSGATYTAVPEGSPIFSEDNDLNPSGSEWDGAFGWDVTAGWYKVRVAKTGHATYESPELQVPPERVDLVLQLSGGTAPTISPWIEGAPIVGVTLGGYVPDDLYETFEATSYTWKRNGTAIATSSTYALVEADVGKEITLDMGLLRAPVALDPLTPATLVTFAPFTASSDTPVIPRVPVGTVVIEGTPTVGQQLRAITGAWGASYTLSYTWLRNGVPIPNATSDSYTLKPADVGKRISVAVRASVPGVSGIFLESAQTAVVKGLVLVPATPTIAGSTAVGSVLTAKPGSWKPAPVTYAYQWNRNGVAISQATKATYKLTSADAGKKITVKVTGTKSGYASASKTSAALTVPGVFTKAPVPTISGTAKSGSKLTAKPGTWAPQPALTYQWYSGGKAIKGATKATYAVKVADHGKKITVKITAKKAGYTTVSKTSKAKAIPVPTFAKAPAPTITGTAKAGKKLTAKPGTWSPAPKFTYQWYRGGKAIKGATKSTYKLVSADKGKKITVKVTGKKTGYVTAAKTSKSKTVSK